MICRLIVLFGLLAASVLSTYTPPSVPFTSTEAAQAWIDDVVALNTAFFNSEIDYDACCAEFDDALSMVDGKEQPAKSRRARFNVMRRKVSAGSVTASCDLDESQFDYGYTLVTNCNDQGVIQLPVIGDYDFDSSTTRRFVFDQEGNIIEHDITSGNAVVGLVMSALITPDNAQNGDADLIVFEFGSYKLDRFDAAILTALMLITSVFGIALCLIMQRVNAMYQYLMPRRGKKLKYAHVASTDEE